ncbi:hypothetical protein C0995_005608 [Termitomyces sp. Mi166|nr:hypothetical protein C0995_005608 [Termitomyces sp. Mi166\
MDIYCDSTPDLVDRIFGKIATVRLAGLVLLTLLHSNLLTVELDGNELIRDQWPEACAVAASSVDAHADPTDLDPSSNLTKNYLWKWCEILDEGTVHGVEIFLNVVGLSAYIAAMTTCAAGELRNRKVTTRFTTLPRSYGPLPVPSGTCSPYSPPDFFALPSTSFVSQNTRNASGRPDEFLEKPLPLRIIEEKFPFIFSRFSCILSDVMDCLEGPSQTRLSTAANPANNPALVSDSTMSMRDELMVFSASLEADLQPYASPQVEQVLREQSQRHFLDLSRVCTPEILLPGVMSIDISARGMRTVMQQQRRSQPWLRSLLGLAIYKDELGPFRADAVGLQEYTFDRTTSSGVIQCIRIALGITVATNEELGIHPAFSFREVERPLSESDQEHTGSDADTEMPPYKKARKEYSVILTRPRLYRYKEVNFCTLENRSLRTSSTPHVNAVEPKMKYYVRYLLEDARTLFGRSTRVWCVYKEVLDEEREKYLQAHGVAKTFPLFVGPFALKMYNADVDHEAFKFDLVQKAIDAKVRHVVLPKHIWYLGKVGQNLRPGGCLQTDDPELDDREEIMMISPFKRTLAQFSDADEFYRGLIDALRGIESLENAGLMHCDVSIDNILLEAELLPASKEVVDFVMFSADGAADTEIALLFKPSGSDGGLHDLDLLERASTHRESDEDETQEPNRAGTLPFMSFQILMGDKHAVIDDMHTPRQVVFKYPDEVKGWADAEAAVYARTKEQLFMHAGAMKTVFFERCKTYLPHPPWLVTAATRSLPFWRNHFTVHHLFLAVFYETLWIEAASNELETVWVSGRRAISPRMLIEKMEKYEEAVRDILKGLK